MPKKAKEEAGKDEFRHLVRLSGVVLDGNLDLERALTRIKGIGPRVSDSFIKSIKMDGSVKVGTLSDADIEKIEESIGTMNKLIPAWMLNRQKDRYTGEDMYLTGADLDISRREDINLQKSIRSYKGIRHSLNLPVRGQRTRTSFRKGTTIGVRRKKGK